MIYSDSERACDLMHLADEELVRGWNDASDADQVGLRVLQCNSMTVVLSFTGLGTWDVVALANGQWSRALGGNKMSRCISSRSPAINSARYARWC